ncbi:type 2 periplasmic-binding domain-containing protein [Geothermobacter ehrlichii]|uniref:hypothetical protein n=1 Tax=Geothermobacter ehrlichii TaxID=213224 RepID=UPI0011E85B29|nr:hypothetical protein [Geothermobacter ehrlichii]
MAIPDSVGNSGGIRQVLKGRVKLVRVARRLTENEASAGQVVYPTLEMRRVLMRTVGSIGYLPLSATRDSGLTILWIDGVAPDGVTTENGRYPYVVPLALVWKPPLSGIAARFKDYLFSAEARRVMQAFGAFPVGVD